MNVEIQKLITQQQPITTANDSTLSTNQFEQSASDLSISNSDS